jgi:hypothetical protein
MLRLLNIGVSCEVSNTREFVPSANCIDFEVNTCEYDPSAKPLSAHVGGGGDGVGDGAGEAEAAGAGKAAGVDCASTGAAHKTHAAMNAAATSFNPPPKV